MSAWILRKHGSGNTRKVLPDKPQKRKKRNRANSPPPLGINGIVSRNGYAATATDGERLSATVLRRRRPGTEMGLAQVVVLGRRHGTRSGKPVRYVSRQSKNEAVRLKTTKKLSSGFSYPKNKNRLNIKNPLELHKLRNIKMKTHKNFRSRVLGYSINVKNIIQNNI